MESSWWDYSCIWRQRQQTNDLASWIKRKWASCTLRPTLCGSKSNQLESTTPWSFSHRRRHSRSTYSILEHINTATNKRNQHWVVSMQLSVLQDQRRTSEHARLFVKLSYCLEVPNDGKNCNPNWPHIQSTLPRYESRRFLNRYWSWRWDFEILEHFLQIEKQPWCRGWERSSWFRNFNFVSFKHRL